MSAQGFRCACVLGERLLGGFYGSLFFFFLLYALQWCCILHNVLPYITLTALQRAFRCHLCFRSIIKIAD